MTVTVYSRPNCMPCKATYRELDKYGVPYEVVDTSEDHDAREYVMGLGYQQSPVVVVGDQHWSGYSPDKIKAVAEAVAA